MRAEIMHEITFCQNAVEIMQEFGQLLAWLNVFGVPWNKQPVGINVLRPVKRFSRIFTKT